MKFCKKCGKEVNDTARFCPNCGAALRESQPETYSSYPETPTLQPKKSGGHGKVIGVIIAAVVIAIVIIVGGIMIAGRSSYEAPIQYVVEGMNKGDAEIILKALPIKEFKKAAKQDADLFDGMDEEEVYNFLISMMNETIRYFREDYVGDINLDYKIYGKEKLDEDDLEWIQEDYADLNIKVDDAYSVDVELIVESGDETESERDDVVVVKIGGKWYMDISSF